MKTEIRAFTHLAPVPAVLVSCGDGKVSDIVTIAWTGTINSDPPMLSISVRRTRYSYEIINKTGEFVVNLVSQDLLKVLDGCGVGGVFQSPSAEQIYNVSKEVEAGAGILYLYGNYTGDIMNFDMAAEMCEMDDIETRSIVGADDVNSNADPAVRRGVAGIFFMYKCAGAKAAKGGTLDEVLAAAQKAKDNTRTVGFALTPCIIPEVGHPNFTLGENEMAMGMGIHGEPGVWNGPIKTADELAKESLDTLLGDMPVAAGEEVCLLINGLGATSVEELYILCNSVRKILDEKGVKVYRTFVGEYATSMEMAGASISICRMADDEMKEQIDMPVKTPFYTQA